jgi:hypothetical protein
MNNNTDLLIELTKYSRPVDTNSYVVYVNADGTKEILTINQAKERDASS